MSEHPPGWRPGSMAEAIADLGGHDRGRCPACQARAAAEWPLPDPAPYILEEIAPPPVTRSEVIRFSQARSDMELAEDESDSHPPKSQYRKRSQDVPEAP